MNGRNLGRMWTLVAEPAGILLGEDALGPLSSYTLKVVSSGVKVKKENFLYSCSWCLLLGYLRTVIKLVICVWMGVSKILI